MTPPISLEEAWERLFALVEPLSGETVAVDKAVGRYLAEPLIARRTQPARDLSVMDGFAVAGPGPWRIVGESRAGTAFSGQLMDGDAVAISTGAACPAGIEGIVILEDADRAGEGLTAPAPRPGRWIRRRGFDFELGTHLLDSGTRIGPGQLALARAAGHGTLTVARAPRVAILECGDELVADPADCPPDRLPASNGAMVAAMAANAGALPQQTGPLPDDRIALANAIAGASDADVIVTTAGASVGQHDHVHGALEDCGAEPVFWRVAIRPGKPLLVGRLGSQIVIGLPGNPSSSFVAAFLFLMPLLRALQGSSRALPVAIPLPLATALGPGGDRREFQRGQFRNGRAVPLDERDSSALATLGRAELLLDRPISAEPAPAGAFVSCYWLGNDGIA